MNESIIKDLININKNLNIPGYLLKYYDKLNLENKEFILLVYLINQKDNIVFDYNKIANDIFIEPNIVLDLINSLNEKNYISIEMKKTNGVIEEFISLELFYNKIISLIIDNNDTKSTNDIFSIFENEFGRTLSPMEIQTINGWIENNIEENLIISALKEAVLSGVNNLRYIDKILFDWNKKGYKKPEDVKNNKSSMKEEIIDEIYDYDWINDD